MSDFRADKQVAFGLLNHNPRHNTRVLAAFLVISSAFLLIIGCRADVSTSASWQGLWKIGVALPFSGYDADSATDILQAIKLAIRDANTRGGVAGYRLELVTLDDGGIAEQARQQARMLAADPTVLGVVGHVQSDTALAAAPEYQTASLPFFALRAPAVALTTSEPAFAFRMGASDRDVAKTVAQFLHNTGVSRFMVISDSSVGHLAQTQEVAQIVRQSGIASVEVSAIEPTQRDFSVLLNRIRSSHIEALYFSGSFQQAGLLVDALSKEELSLSCLINDEADCPGFKRLVPTPALDVHCISTVENLMVDSVYDRNFQQVTGMLPLSNARNAYDAINVLLQAAEKTAGQDRYPKREQILAELRRGVASSGTSGALCFDSRGNRLGAEARPYLATTDTANSSEALRLNSLQSGNDHVER